MDYGTMRLIDEAARAYRSRADTTAATFIEAALARIADRNGIRISQRYADRLMSQHNDPNRAPTYWLWAADRYLNLHVDGRPMPDHRRAARALAVAREMLRAT